MQPNNIKIKCIKLMKLGYHLNFGHNITQSTAATAAAAAAAVKALKA